MAGERDPGVSIDIASSLRSWRRPRSVTPAMGPSAVSIRSRSAGSCSGPDSGSGGSSPSRWPQFSQYSSSLPITSSQAGQVSSTSAPVPVSSPFLVLRPCLSPGGGGPVSFCPLAPFSALRGHRHCPIPPRRRDRRGGGRGRGCGSGSYPCPRPAGVGPVDQSAALGGVGGGAGQGPVGALKVTAQALLVQV